MKRPFLRTYRYVAQQEHWCDRCCNYIHPGEMYEGLVQVTQNDRIFVTKTHVSPTCNPPEDPNEEEERALEQLAREEAARSAA